MTTDHDLRDLLTAEADGPLRAPAGWDDVVRRGHRHRRVTRLRNGLAMGGLTAVVAVGVIAVADRDAREDVTANEPVTTTSVSDPPVGPIAGPGIEAMARVQGVFVTVVAEPGEQGGIVDLCETRHPRATESATEVVIELVPASLSSGAPWAGCQASAMSAWGTIELTDPLGDRTLVDATDGDLVSVIDGGPLLFPTELPEPFDLATWDEFPGAPPGWTFSWSDDDLFVNVTTEPSDALACDAEPMEMRGVTGQVCLADASAVLGWDEGGLRRQIEIGHVGGGTSPFILDEIAAIAEGLEPLGG